MTAPESHQELAKWIERLPIAEAVVRAPEAAWFATVAIAAPSLDIGCGDGSFGANAYSAPITIGMDITEANARRARNSGVYRLTLVGDVRRLPFRSGVFSTIFSNGALEHVPGVEDGMREIARVVRPGGRLAMTVPGERCGGADRAKRGEFVAPWESLINRLWHHVNLHPPAWWNQPAGTWEVEQVHHYFGPRAYHVCLLFFWLGGPWAVMVRGLTGRKVLCPAFRRLWADPIARLIGKDTTIPENGSSYALALRRY
jgi:SAM-dependent methyltransferase